MECRTARLLLTFARPFTTELEASEVAALESHLADCPDCGPLARAESRADQHLSQVMRSVPIPEGLQARLLARLDIKPVPWYKKRRLQSVAGLAAAAALFLAIWLGFDWGFKRITLDPEQVASDALSPVFNPTPRSVEDWFLESRKTKTTPPTDFKYSLLSFYDLADLQGEQVPFLLFTQNRNQARVYILSEKKFDLQAARATPPDMGSACKVQVRSHPDDPGVAYLVVYTGESLDQFLSDNPPPST